MITLKVPAKINLTLEVLRKRKDGFHEIKSVLQTIDLCDTLHIDSDKRISFQCDMPEWSAKNSLLSKAVKLLQKVSGSKQGAVISLEKRIPLLSGLGGDSSDAATLLKGLNDFWGLDLSFEKLKELAMRLGSDVPFFLDAGTALAEGRGEIITPLPTLEKLWILITLPGIEVGPYKTAKMYASLNTSCFTDGSITDHLVKVIKERGMPDSSLLFNVFKEIAFHVYSGLLLFNISLIKIGICDVYLAGSGPTLFSVYREKTQAELFYQRCKDQGMKVYLASTL